MADEREPNSKGFWRANEIAGLEMMLYPRAPEDPEDLAWMQSKYARYRELKAEDARVKARRDRIRASSAAKPQP